MAKAKQPESKTIPALISGARRVTQEKRPVWANRVRPATTVRPTPTSVKASPRLKARTVRSPTTVAPEERANNMTVIDAGQGISPPAEPKVRICITEGRSPRAT